MPTMFTGQKAVRTVSRETLISVYFFTRNVKDEGLREIRKMPEKIDGGFRTAWVC